MEEGRWKYTIKEKRRLTKEEAEGNIFFEEKGWKTLIDTEYGELTMITINQPSPKMIDKHVSEACMQKFQEQEALKNTSSNNTV